MLEKFEADRGWKKSFGGGLEEGTDWWSISYTGSGSILNTIHRRASTCQILAFNPYIHIVIVVVGTESSIQNFSI